jgi:hypothetical protein
LRAHGFVSSDLPLEILEGEGEHVYFLDHQFDLVKQIGIERGAMLTAAVRPRGLAPCVICRICLRRNAGASRVYRHARETDATGRAPYDKFVALPGAIKYRKLP